MTRETVFLVIDAFIILLIITAIGLFRKPPDARRGTFLATLAMVFAIAAVLVRMEIRYGELIAAALVVGAAVGLVVAAKVNMIQIPAMIAFQHGAGGMAAFLVCFVEVWRGAGGEIGPLQVVSGLAGLLVGAGTFSASMVAAGKLAGILPSRPTILRGHNPILLAITLIAIAIAVVAGLSAGTPLVALLVAAVVVTAVLGVGAAVRIGGADMPVLISSLNATAGFAAAFSGIILGSYLLVAAGATVAASGSVLTHVMCKAMNRNLFQVFAGTGRAAAKDGGMSESLVRAGAAAVAVGGATAGAASAPSAAAQESAPADPYVVGAEALKGARSVIIVPGYGMAVAQAQFELVSLAKKLADNGIDVKYAIHPVAGRMPGHMNVLLAEADVSYDRLVEMDEINPRFADADVALVVGACDVVNSAAIESEGTPISGMPILRAMDAKTVVVCNYDEKPGYSGVENPLYAEAKSVLLWGDAKQTLATLGALLPEADAHDGPAT